MTTPLSHSPRIPSRCVNEPRSALKAHRPNDVLTTPHGAREGTTSRRATLVTAAPNVQRLGQLRRASWRPCRACGSTHVTRRPPSLLEQKQEVLCLRLLPLLGAERRPPVIHRNSGDPISCCTLFNAGSVALDSHVVALRWIRMCINAAFSFGDGHENVQEIIFKLIEQLFRKHVNPLDLEPLNVFPYVAPDNVKGFYSRNNRRLVALMMYQACMAETR